MKLLTVKEVAEILKVSNQTVYNWTSKGELIPIKVGGAVRIKEQELNRFLDDNTVKQIDGNTGKQAEKTKPDNIKSDNQKK
jgi:excisionase family DNA binding protein